MLDDTQTGLSRTHMRERSARALRWALVATLLLAWVCIRPPLPAQAVTFNGHVEGAEGDWWGARPDYTPMSASEYADEITKSARIGPLPAERQREDVQAGSVVSLRAVVTDGRTDELMRYSRVTFTIVSGDYVRRVAAHTGKDGIASVRQRIPRESEGSVVVVTAWADTKEWSAGDYLWFIAE